MNGTDIISCLRRKYIIRRKPYIILRQQYIMMHKAYLRRPFLLAFLLLHLNYQPCGYQSPSPTELSEVGGKACDAPPVADEASRVWRSGQFFVSVSEQEKLGTTRGSVTVNHDAVGSSPTGGAKKKALASASAFFNDIRSLRNG